METELVMVMDFMINIIIQNKSKLYIGYIYEMQIFNTLPFANMT